METAWVKCTRCNGKGYHYNEHLGSYPCELCDGVGGFECIELPDPSVDAETERILQAGLDTLKPAT